MLFIFNKSISVRVVLKRRYEMKKISEDNTFLVYKCPYCGSGKITINKTGAHKYG